MFNVNWGKKNLLSALPTGFLASMAQILPVLNSLYSPYSESEKGRAGRNDLVVEE